MTAPHSVTEEEAGERLDVLLADWLDVSRSQAQKQIERGLVVVDDEVALKSMRPEAGAAVTIREADLIPSPEAPPVAIRWQDDHLAVVVKPADLVVHAGAGVRGATLVDSLIAQGVALAASADPDRPGIVHRLDRGTSGLLVIAKTPAALDAMQALFRDHDIHREYWTLVEGHPDPPAATIDAPIVRSRSNRTTFTTGDDGRRAISHYATLATHPATAEVAVTLETGRTHQVRVHLRAVGRPVAGDVLYGASADLARRLGLGRQALHARRLSFVHPMTGATVDCEEPLPADLVAARDKATSGVGGPWGG